MSYDMIMKRASNLSDQDLGLRYKWDRTVFIGNLSYECKWPVLKDFMKQNVGEVTYCDVFEENGKSSGTAAVEFKSPEDVKNACRNTLKLLNRKLNIYADEEGRRTRKAAQQCLVARVMAGRKEVVNHGDGFRRGHPLQSPVFHGGPMGIGSPGHSSGRANRLSPPFRSRHPDSGTGADDMPISDGAQNKLFDLLRRLGIEANQLTSHIVVSNLDSRITKQKLFDVFSLSGQIIDITIMPSSERGAPVTASIQFDRVVDAIQAIAMLDNQCLYDRRMVVKLSSQMLEPTSPPRLPAGLSGVGERLNIDELLSSRNMQSDPPRQGFAYGRPEDSTSSRRKRPGNFQDERNRMPSPRENASSSQFTPAHSNGQYNRFSRGNNDMISNSDADIYDDLRRRLKNPKLSLGNSHQGRGMGSPQRRSLGVASSRSVGFDGQITRGFDDLHLMRSSYGGSEGKLRSSMFPPMRGSGHSRNGPGLSPYMR